MFELETLVCKKKEDLVNSSSMTAKKLFCNVFAYDCHNGIKSSAISVDV